LAGGIAAPAVVQAQAALKLPLSIFTINESNWRRRIHDENGF